MLHSGKLPERSNMIDFDNGEHAFLRKTGSHFFRSMLLSIFRRSGSRFGEKKMLKESLLRDFLSIGRFRPIGKRAGSHELEIDRFRPLPLLVGLYFETHALALGKRAQTRPLDCRHMNEYIAPAVVRLDEAKAFIEIEKLDGALLRHDTPSFRARASDPRRRALSGCLSRAWSFGVLESSRHYAASGHSLRKKAPRVSFGPLRTTVA
jgi:hypothetical protein